MSSADTRSQHFKHVLDLLPPRYQVGATIHRNRHTLRVNGRVSVLTRKSSNCVDDYDQLVVSLDYGLKKELEDRFHNRVYKRNKRTHSYNYSAVAAFITKVMDAYAAIEARRATGQSMSEKTGQRLKALFKSDPLLQGLGLSVRADPVLNTEIGETRIYFVEESTDPGVHSYHAFEFMTAGQGNVFSTQLDLSGLSAEQVIALVTILRADKLNLLDMLFLADDSILGPIIKKLTQEKEDEE